jgi:hypothetical protein
VILVDADGPALAKTAVATSNAAPVPVMIP